MENKKKSTLLKDAIALFLITLISGLALSYIYEITKAPIATQQNNKKIEAYQAVYNEANTFEVDGELMKILETADLTSINPSYSGNTIDEVSQALDSSGKTLGYIVKVTTTNSYKDSISLTFGYSLEGEIKGMEILSISETAGLGMNAQKSEFKNQFANKSVEQFVTTKSGATADNEIDAISGATITTNAVVNAVNSGIGFITEYAMD